MDEKHNARIQLTDDIGILMSYPNLAAILAEKNDDLSNAEKMFNMISECMYQIWHGEETFDAMDYSIKDKKDFIESLNHEQFEKIQQFFDTMPQLKHEEQVTNPKTGVESKIVLEGMNSFF